MKNGSGIVEIDIAKSISQDCEVFYSNSDLTPTVHDIEDFVYNSTISCTVGVKSELE